MAVYGFVASAIVHVAAQVAEFKSIGGRRTLVSKKPARRKLKRVGTAAIAALTMFSEWFARQMGHSGSLPSLTGGVPQRPRFARCNRSAWLLRGQFGPLSWPVIADQRKVGSRDARDMSK